MNSYKTRLYDAYISSGQAATRGVFDPEKLFASNSPFIQRIINKYFDSHDKTNRIIDVACGHGAFVYLLKKNNYANVYGFDISEEQINLGHKLGINSIECKSIDQFLKNNKEPVDIFLLIDILEHLTPDELFILLDSLYVQLNSNGKLIIHVPNAEGIFGMQIRYGDLTHETSFTSKSIYQLLTTIGFNNIACFEDKPAVHGFKSLIRRFLWESLTVYFRLLSIAETGVTNSILSRNMIVIAQKTN